MKKINHPGPKLENLSGRRFGRLAVLSRASNGKMRGSKIRWLCRCDCGKSKIIPGRQLRGKIGHNVRSCGCLRDELISKVTLSHGRGRCHEAIMVYNARQRSKRNGIKFSITIEDIVIPSHCPLLGSRLVRIKGKHNHNSPSLDRINPKLGYVPENVWVISRRANTIKSNATVKELRMILLGIENKLSERKTRRTYEPRRYKTRNAAAQHAQRKRTPHRRTKAAAGDGG